MARHEDNLVSQVERWMFESDLLQGDGSELKPQKSAPPKFHAAHSSSALAVNSFAPWKQETDALSLAGVTGFTALQFERRCPMDGRSHRQPNLDLVATGSGRAVAVESKCAEYLSPKKAAFADRYEVLIDRLGEPCWRDVYHRLKSDPRAFSYVDAAQLVKHYLGLRNTFAGAEVTLLYLYWEPSNAAEYKAFRVHRKELVKLSGAVRSSTVRLVAQSYSELWAQWSEWPEPAWLRAHVRNLRSKYSLQL